MHFAEAVPAGEKICEGIGRAAFDWAWSLRSSQEGSVPTFTNEHVYGGARPTCETPDRCAGFERKDCRKPDCHWSPKESSCRAHAADSADSGEDRCGANKQKKSCKEAAGCRWKKNRCESEKKGKNK